ncbi:MAG: NAD-dependent 4,6-dehydratase LegB [bacterium]
MAEFWKDKKVVVTGSDGFIGSHLVEHLARAGAWVRAFVYYNSFSRWGWLDETDEEILGCIEIFPGDIRDALRVAKAIEGQEIVFHLSSLIAIPYSYCAPDSYVQTNVGGALNVLNACRLQQVTRLVHTSTSEVYGTAQYVPIDEKHPLQGQSPYSASKIGADMLAESYYRSFNLPVVIARPFNTYGPRQSARAVIPTILIQLYKGASQLSLGSLQPTRDFNFVQDTVSGFLALGQTDAAVGNVVNIGSGQEIAIGDLVQLLLNISGKKADVVCDDDRLRPEKSEVNRLLCDASLLKKLTGWSPQYSLEKGLEITAEWIKRKLNMFQGKTYTI